MSVRDEIMALARKYTVSSAEIDDNTDLFGPLPCGCGIYGDDTDEFLSDFIRRFNVDMSKYLWYFHTEEESGNFFGWLFPPPNARVEHIPVTIRLLIQAAELKTWPVEYPPHLLPKRRWDTIASLGCIIWVLLFAIGVATLHFVIDR
jgi:hypothetical protein